ncbi:molybdenum cofactor guanylyltransferase MobA [Pseudemcibacter aquimaris]|uniref:molybdenum cofactor guanylyltransferase MobA n=1 Tax=Pseudemcibacter aquimaris TaxID=2857064 RepID=UPI0020110349|nr:molybdenum cofactor guanylyltransferase MobA [Pseudemcibacter aquimaris]MCC3861801.1 molybdenum cofactor guanylyltransferase [Pseudemcibacter aquimaris]WDU58556.1 molybdenum cofactor guanylyltransferase [Pseudemcibacter aquimaris]
MSNQDQRPLYVILAGGGSSRMGGVDKYTLMLGERPILDHIIARIEPQASKILFNCNKEIDVSLTVIRDQKPNLGPLGGIQAALEYAKEKGYNSVITVACDTPFIPENLTSRLQSLEGNPLVIAASNGRLHPVVARWYVSLLDQVTEALDQGERKLMKFIDNIEYAICEWNEPRDPFFNINRPEDLKKAESLF